MTKKRSAERNSSMRFDRFEVCNCEISDVMTSGEPYVRTPET